MKIHKRKRLLQILFCSSLLFWEMQFMSKRTIACNRAMVFHAVFLFFWQAGKLFSAPAASGIRRIQITAQQCKTDAGDRYAGF